MHAIQVAEGLIIMSASGVFAPCDRRDSTTRARCVYTHNNTVQVHMDSTGGHCSHCTCIIFIYIAYTVILFAQFQYTDALYNYMYKYNIRYSQVCLFSVFYSLSKSEHPSN